MGTRAVRPYSARGLFSLSLTAVLSACRGGPLPARDFRVRPRPFLLDAQRTLAEDVVGRLTELRAHFLVDYVTASAKCDGARRSLSGGRESAPAGGPPPDGGSRTPGEDTTNPELDSTQRLSLKRDHVVNQCQIVFARFATSPLLRERGFPVTLSGLGAHNASPKSCQRRLP